MDFRTTCISEFSQARYVHKKRTILITTTYIESNLPSNAVAAIQSTEPLLPGADGAQNECVR